MSKTAKKSKVVVKSEYCKGCGLCIEHCKSNKLEFSSSLNKMGYKFAEPVESEKCTGCMICTWMCPDVCIEVYDE